MQLAEPCSYRTTRSGVCDVDQHPKIRQAINLAEQNGVKMALSNPSFEFWLVLHFEKFTTTGTPRHKILSRLKNHIPRYAKGTSFKEILLPRVEAAVRHSTDIWKAQWCCKPSSGTDVLDRNPSTLVHNLVVDMMPPGA